MLCTAVIYYAHSLCLVRNGFEWRWRKVVQMYQAKERILVVENNIFSSYTVCFEVRKYYQNLQNLCILCKLSTSISPILLHPLYHWRCFDSRIGRGNNAQFLSSFYLFKQLSSIIPLFLLKMLCYFTVNSKIKIFLL